MNRFRLEALILLALPEGAHALAQLELEVLALPMNNWE